MKPPFQLGKIGHIALHVADISASKRFYTEVLGFEVSDEYPEDMQPSGAVFLRCNPDHHGIALFQAKGPNPPDAGMHHLAFEVPTLDDVFKARAHLRAHNVPIDFDGRRRAGVQIAVEFRDPDGHRLEIYWGLDQLSPGETGRPREEWKWAHSLEEAIANPVRGQDTTVKETALLRQRSAEEAA